MSTVLPWEKFFDLLPKLKTKIQLAGLILGVAAFLAARSVHPDLVFAQICAGAVGVVILGLGFSFNVINHIEKTWRPLFIVMIFGMSLVFILGLAFLSIRNLVPLTFLDPLNPAERRVEQVRQERGLIWGMVEGCRQTPSFCQDARKLSPQYAGDLLGIDDRSLRPVYRVRKYTTAAFFFVSAATVNVSGESGYCQEGASEPLRSAYRGVENADRALDEIDGAKKAGARGESEALQALDFIRSKEVEPTLEFYKAICWAVVVRCASNHRKEEARQNLVRCIRVLKEDYGVFLSRITLESNQHIRWFLKTAQGGSQ